MTSTVTSPLPVVLATSIALVDQFLSSLQPGASHDIPDSTAEAPSPLLLLDAAARSLKSQVTKLSLLTITAPFTATALVNCLQPLNESILTSLVTASLLTTPETFSQAFASECRSLTRSTLRELVQLLHLVDARSKSKDLNSEVPALAKKEITEATGRVWEYCDGIVKFSNAGFVGFVMHRGNQWLELMKDAVKELQEWDPEEDVSDQVFGDMTNDNDDHETTNQTGEKGDDRAMISAGVRDQALKVLVRIPQSVHVVLKQRLEKIRARADADVSPSTRRKLDRIVSKLRNVSELIDESAEGMYLGDLEMCLKKAGEARALTIEIVQSVLRPVEELEPTETTEETKEDKYVRRALDWIKQVDTNGYQTKPLP